jgi:hypothetical protein
MGVIQTCFAPASFDIVSRKSSKGQEPWRSFPCSLWHTHQLSKAETRSHSHVKSVVRFDFKSHSARH